MSRLRTWKVFVSAFLLVFLNGPGAQAQTAAERDAWNAARSANTVEAYLAFIGAFPDGVFVEQALSGLGALGVQGRIVVNSRLGTASVYGAP